MHAGQPGVKGNANNVEIVAGIRDKLFLGHPAYCLDLVADTRGLFKFQRRAGFLHTGDQLGQYLIIFSG
jgi:hypothetical protein